MEWPDSAERAGKEFSFILLVFIPRESTGHIDHSKKTAGIGKRQERGSHCKHIPEGQQGKSALQFPNLNNFRGSWNTEASLVVSYLAVE